MHPAHIKERLRQIFQLLAVVTLAIVVMWLLNSILGESSAPVRQLPDAGSIQSVRSPSPSPLVPQQDI